MKSFWCALIAAYALVATCTHAQDSMGNAVKTGGESSQTDDLIAGAMSDAVTTACISNFKPSQKTT